MTFAEEVIKQRIDWHEQVRQHPSILVVFRELRILEELCNIMQRCSTNDDENHMWFDRCAEYHNRANKVEDFIREEYAI